MELWQERIIAERDELAKKTYDLRKAIDDGTIPLEAKRLWRLQENAMALYLDVLNRRIAAFT